MPGRKAKGAKGGAESEEERRMRVEVERLRDDENRKKKEEQLRTVLRVWEGALELCGCLFVVVFVGIGVCVVVSLCLPLCVFPWMDG